MAELTSVGWVEGAAFGEDFGFVAFAIGKEFTEGVLDEGRGSHDGRRGGRVVVIYLSQGTLAACGLRYKGEGAKEVDCNGDSVLGWEKWKASPWATLSFHFLAPR